jgi:hypothetical protein
MEIDRFPVEGLLGGGRYLGLRPAPRCWRSPAGAKDPPDELASSVLLLAYPRSSRCAPVGDGYRAIVFTPLLRPTPGRSGSTARVHGAGDPARGLHHPGQGTSGGTSCTGACDATDHGRR